MTHIPLLIWLSDKFMASQPERVKTLRGHADRVWTNDLLYDLLVGLTGVSVEAYDPKYDLSSSSYQLDWSTALTLHGRRRVIDDPDLVPALAQAPNGLSAAAWGSVPGGFAASHGITN
jgi:heptose-I-phosphate ethanolaminephosphotransferase